jgi:hypothetical protein
MLVEFETQLCGPRGWEIEGKYVGGYGTITLLVNAARMSGHGVVCRLNTSVTQHYCLAIKRLLSL